MTRDAIERVVSLLETTDDLMKEMKSLLYAIRLPVVAAGLLYYLRGNLLSDELISEPESVHFVLLDQIATTHPNLQIRYYLFFGVNLISNLNDIFESAQSVG